MEVEDGHDIDIAVLIYNLIDYSDNHSQKSGMLLQHCKDAPMPQRLRILMA